MISPGVIFPALRLPVFDFSGCTIDGAIWSMDKLKNMTVNLNQALELAKLLGLRIVP